MKRYNDITFILGALPLIIACGASPSYDQNVVRYTDNSVVVGNLELGVFNAIERDKNYEELVKPLILKEHEDIAYKADVSRSIAKILHSGSIKYNEGASNYVIPLDFSKAPLNTYFDENLDLKDSETQKFSCHMFFLPKISDNGFYHINLKEENIKVTYSYDYLDEDSRELEFTPTLEELYYHSNVMMFDLSHWITKKGSDEVSKMSNFKLTITGNVILNSIK